MKTFSYKGFDQTGRKRKGLVEANDVKSAREKLANAGILPSRVSPAGSTVEKSKFFGTGNFTVSERTFFFRELSVLLSAGMPLTSALDTLIEAPDAGGSRLRMAAVRDSIKEGSSFAGALNEHACGLSDYETTVIESGERTGSLAETLDGLSDFLENRAALNESVQSAMIYPTIVLAAAVVIAVVLLGFAVPQMARMLGEHGNLPLPALTRFMLSAGRIAAVGSVPLILLALLAVIWLKRNFNAESNAAEKLSEAVFSIPVVGPAYSMLVSLRFAKTLSLLLSGGTPLLDAMTLAGKASGNIWVKRLAAEEADRVRHGERLAQAVRNIPPLAGLLPRWIEIGESSGSMDKMLSEAAAHLQKKWESFINRKMKLLEPLVLMLVGGFVLLVTLSIVLPITAINRMGI